MSNIIPIDKEYFLDGSAMINEINLKGIITFANRKFCEVSGYELSEIVGKNYMMLRHPDMPEAITEKMRQALQGSQSWSGIVKNIRKDGSFYWSEAEAIAIYDADEKVKGYIEAKRTASRKNIQEAEELYEKMLKS